MVFLQSAAGAAARSDQVTETYVPGEANTAPGSGLQDLADVLRLIRAADLPRDFTDRIDPYVRGRFEELWLASQHPDDDY